jgi:tRNA modification GTPase
VLVVLDASQPESAEDKPLLDQIKNRTAILVENKSDLGTLQSRGETIRTSALTGEGIPELRAAILRHVTGDAGSGSEAGFLTNARHQSLVRDSLTALDAAQAAVHSRIPHEMLLLDLYGALRPLDEITGATTNDDILNLIFSRFCIGK